MRTLQPEMGGANGVAALEHPARGVPTLSGGGRGLPGTGQRGDRLTLLPRWLCGEPAVGLVAFGGVLVGAGPSGGRLLVGAQAFGFGGLAAQAFGAVLGLGGGGGGVGGVTPAFECGELVGLGGELGGEFGVPALEVREGAAEERACLSSSLSSTARSRSAWVSSRLVSSAL